MYLEEPALQHGSNEAIDKFIRVRGAEISSEKCQKLTVWFGKALNHTSRRISQAHNLGLIYRLLRWNGVAKTVLLNTINPILEKIYFLP